MRAPLGSLCIDRPLAIKVSLRTAQRVIRYHEFSVFTARREADLDGVFRTHPSIWSPSGSQRPRVMEVHSGP